MLFYFHFYVEREEESAAKNVVSRGEGISEFMQEWGFEN